MSAEMEEVSAAIANIADVSRKMSNETQTIAQAAEEQLASMEQLRQSADELEKMSRQLKEDLSRFVLREI
jgi:methyl-accepting chemotaxis protein